MLPFVSRTLAWLGWLGSLNNNDESVYLFLKFFSKLPLHQVLNSSIQAATDTSKSLLAWSSQEGRTLSSWQPTGSVTLRPKERGKLGFSERWEAYLFKLIMWLSGLFLSTFSPPLLEKWCVSIFQCGDLFKNCFMHFTLP